MVAKPETLRRGRWRLWKMKLVVLAGRVSNDAIRVKGENKLSNGRRCAYQYVAQLDFPGFLPTA